MKNLKIKMENKMLFNIKTTLFAEKFDLEDTYKRLSFFSELIKIELVNINEDPVWSIEWTNKGFVIQFGRVMDYQRAKSKISEVLAGYDWIDAIVNMKVLLQSREYYAN